MRIKGKTIEEVNRKEVTIPRANGEHIVFTVQAVLDMEVFEKTVPEINPPDVLIKGERIPNFEDKTFLDQVAQRNRQRTSWLILQSLKATPELEWDLVKMEDPNTWGMYFEEMKKAGFTTYEIVKITNAIFEVNGLTSEKFEAAKQSFLPSTPSAPKQ